MLTNTTLLKPSITDYRLPIMFNLFSCLCSRGLTELIDIYDKGSAWPATSALWRGTKQSDDVSRCGLLIARDRAGCVELFNNLFGIC